MKDRIKIIIVGVLAFVLVSLFCWRCMQVGGLVRCLPAEAISRYERIMSGEEGIGISDLNVHCPICHEPVKALYYGIGDSHLVEYSPEGFPLWEWRGCLDDGTCWQCIKCNRRFDKKGRNI